jgi:hypothetical protein
MRKLFPAAVLAAMIGSFISCASAPEPASPQQAESGGASSSAAKDRAKALAQGGLDAGTPAPAPAPSADKAAQQQAAAPSASADQPPPPPSALTPEEEAFLANYLGRMNYMVYYDEKTTADPILAKRAVSQANRYLIEKLGLSVIDFDQIEKNKKDQLAAYQSETGGSIDLIQYLAQKFNADVYVELSFSVSSEARDSRYYATASGAMKIFDVSTATLLGSIVLASGGTAMGASAEVAATNAVTAPIWQAMPKMIDQSKQLIKNSLGRGIRYEVILQKTPDSRAVSQLRRALAKKVREVEQVSYSPAATTLYVYTFQAGDKVEDALYDAAGAAGMPDLNLVYSRGKSYTFDTGS